MCITRNSQIARLLMKSVLLGKRTFNELSEAVNNAKELGGREEELSKAGVEVAKCGRRIRKAFISERSE